MTVTRLCCGTAVSRLPSLVLDPHLDHARLTVAQPLDPCVGCGRRLAAEVELQVPVGDLVGLARCTTDSPRSSSSAR